MPRRRYADKLFVWRDEMAAQEQGSAQEYVDEEHSSNDETEGMIGITHSGKASTEALMG
jgi:hypothetical protein